VALFEIGADTTSLKVLRDDEMLYDRDQAFGGSQLTQLISRQYGFSFEEAEPRSWPATCRKTTSPAILAPFVDSLSQEIGRALQYFFTSTPHHKVHYVMLAGGTATLPGLKDRVTDLTGFASMVVNPFEHEARLGGAREQGAPGGAVLPHRLRPGDAEVPAVILINLLPHREKSGKQRKQAFFVGLGCGGAGRRGGRVCGSRAAADDAAQESRNDFLGRDHASSKPRSRTSPRCAPRSKP
jgi:hypothetical protein